MVAKIDRDYLLGARLRHQPRRRGAARRAHRDLVPGRRQPEAAGGAVARLHVPARRRACTRWSSTSTTRTSSQRESALAALSRAGPREDSGLRLVAASRAPQLVTFARNQTGLVARLRPDAAPARQPALAARLERAERGAGPVAGLVAARRPRALRRRAAVRRQRPQTGNTAACPRSGSCAQTSSSELLTFPSCVPRPQVGFCAGPMPTLGGALAIASRRHRSLGLRSLGLAIAALGLSFLSCAQNARFPAPPRRARLLRRVAARGSLEREDQELAVAQPARPADRRAAQPGRLGARPGLRHVRDRAAPQGRGRDRRLDPGREPPPLHPGRRDRSLGDPVRGDRRQRRRLRRARPDDVPPAAQARLLEGRDLPLDRGRHARRASTTW